MLDRQEIMDEAKKAIGLEGLAERLVEVYVSEGLDAMNREYCRLVVTSVAKVCIRRAIEGLLQGGDLRFECLRRMN